MSADYEIVQAVFVMSTGRTGNTSPSRHIPHLLPAARRDRSTRRPVKVAGSLVAVVALGAFVGLSSAPQARAEDGSTKPKACVMQERTEALADRSRGERAGRLMSKARAMGRVCRYVTGAPWLAGEPRFSVFERPPATETELAPFLAWPIGPGPVASVPSGPPRSLVGGASFRRWRLARLFPELGGISTYLAETTVKRLSWICFATVPTTNRPDLLPMVGCAKSPRKAIGLEGTMGLAGAVTLGEPAGSGCSMVAGYSRDGVKTVEVNGSRGIARRIPVVDNVWLATHVPPTGVGSTLDARDAQGRLVDRMPFGDSCAEWGTSAAHETARRVVAVRGYAGSGRMTMLKRLGSGGSASSG